MVPLPLQGDPVGNPTIPFVIYRLSLLREPTSSSNPVLKHGLFGRDHRGRGSTTGVYTPQADGAKGCQPREITAATCWGGLTEAWGSRICTGEAGRMS